MKTGITTQRLAWDIAGISEATGLSKSFLRKDIRKGVLRVRKFGRRSLVLDTDLQKYLQEAEAKEPDGGRLI